MSTVIRVGAMPGRIDEYAVEVGTSIQDVIALAGLNVEGHEVKVDGVKVTDLNTPITDSNNLILLAKVVKGNADKTVRVGAMPGRIDEYAVETGTSIQDVIQLAGLSVDGHEVKVDGVKITDLSTPITENTNLILLAKVVKGNK